MNKRKETNEKKDTTEEQHNHKFGCQVSVVLAGKTKSRRPLKLGSASQSIES